MKRKSRRPAAAKSSRKSIMRHSREGVKARRPSKKKRAPAKKVKKAKRNSAASRTKAASRPGQARGRAKAKRKSSGSAKRRTAPRRGKAASAPPTATTKKPASRPVAAKRAARGARPNSASSIGAAVPALRRPARRRGLPGGSASTHRRRDTEDWSLSDPLDARGIGSEAGGQSGDTEGLSRAELAAPESVEELVEEGQAFEAGVVDGVENAPDADRGPIRTREVPEDDVPEEYLDDEKPPSSN